MNVLALKIIFFQDLDTVIDALFDLMDEWDSIVWEGLINEGIVKAICDFTLLHVKIFSEEEKRAGLEAEVSVQLRRLP